MEPLWLAPVAVVAVLLGVLARLRRGGESAAARESRAAHEAARERDPPVDIGETHEFGVTELTDHHSGEQVAVGKVEGFVVFAEDVPDSIAPGDVIRAKIMSFNEGRTSADAMYVDDV